MGQSKYYRNCNPMTYCEVRGDEVFYFAPHVPNGFRTSDDGNITVSVVEKYAAKQPHLDGEIDLAATIKIRSSWPD